MNTLGIRRRIKSIRNTRQITKAMELVAATKMRRTQAQALRTRTYSSLSWKMVTTLAKKIDRSAHKLLREPVIPNTQLIILFSSNRGLAGSFNAQIISKTLDLISKGKTRDSNFKTDLIVIGKKGADAMVRNNQNIIADFKKIDSNLRVEDILALSSMVIEKFSDGTYDRVSVAYTDFISTINQKPRIKQILPFSKLEQLEKIEKNDDLEKLTISERNSQRAERDYDLDYVFEPSAEEVLDNLLPRLVEVQLYQAALESNASEHSARMVAMKNASDAAADIISDLTLEYNQMRQSAITQEIAEISAGRMALG